MSGPWKATVRGEAGITLLEMLVAGLIFLVVAGAMASLYLFSSRSFEVASTEAFVQRQGTLLEEELTRHIQRATALQVQVGGSPSVLCRPAGATIGANESLMYQRVVQNAGTGLLQSEFWCVYRHQPVSVPYPLLYRCPLAGLTPPQDCTQAGENLLAAARVPPGQAVEVSAASFALSPVASPVAPTVDLRFDLNVRATPSGAPVLFSPRSFAFNTTLRN